MRDIIFINNTGDLMGRKYKGTYYENVKLFASSNFTFISNLVISKSNGIDEPWIIVTNGNVKDAIRHYSHRFGGVESLFKNQKSNGFYLESVNNASLKSFTTMYTMACFATLFLTIIGADYTKNTKCYKIQKLTTYKKYRSILDYRG